MLKIKRDVLLEKNNKKEKRRTKKKNQKGGNIPGKFPESYSTPSSDYSNATNPELDWKAKQPYWSPKGR